jgi:2-dehydropantoate 2-reductase
MSRVALIGPGAIGLAIAAAVDLAPGESLQVCSRRPLEQISVTDEMGRTRVLPATVSTDPATVKGPFDWILLAVKTHQTEGAAEWLEALSGDRTRVLVLQNGVEHRERVEPLLRVGTVVPAIVWTAAETAGPGSVRIKEIGRLVVAADEHGAAVEELLGGGALTIEQSADFRTAAWGKLCANAVASLMAPVRRRAEVFGEEDVAALGLALAEEVVTVANAAGAELPDSTAANVITGLRARPTMTTSILVDWLDDRPTEWAARNGIVQATGRRLGVPTPVSDVLVPLLAAGSGSGQTEPATA